MRKYINYEMNEADEPTDEEKLRLLFFYYYDRDEHFHSFVNHELRVGSHKSKDDEPTRYVHKLVKAEDGSLEYQKVAVYD